MIYSSISLFTLRIPEKQQISSRIDKLIDKIFYLKYIINWAYTGVYTAQGPMYRHKETGDGMNARLMAIMILCLLIIPTNRAFIYMATVMHKWDDCAQRSRWFIGLGDYHCKEHPITLKHRQELEQLLAETQQGRCKLLVEDLSSKNADGRFNCGRFQVNSRGGLLGGLTDVCQSYGIATHNLEYRYTRVCALGPILNKPHADPYSFASVRGITAGQMHAEVADELANIAQYNDGMLLNRWYAERTQAVMRRLVTLRWQQMATMSAADMLADLKPLERQKKIEDLLTFDSSLFDIKLVHAIVQNDAERIYAIAGGSHIKRVRVLLQKLGYVQVDVGVVSCSDEQASVADSIECFDERFADQPRPIDLQWLKRFF
jgi:hypothetical protein